MNITMRVIAIYEYDLNPDRYGTTDPEECAQEDEDMFKASGDFAYPVAYADLKSLTVEPVIIVQR